MSQKTQNILLEIIYFGSALILFLPLLVLKTTIYPFIFPKVIFFQIIVEIIFAVWLGLAIYEPKFRPNWKNPVLISLIVFVSFLILSGIFGLDIYRSFYSTQERMTGILTWLHLLIWFIILSSVFTQEKEIKKLIWITLIVSFLVGLYGIGQRFGLSFLIKDKNVRLTSTLGNPIFLGVYSMMHFFLGLFLFLKEKRKIRFFTLALSIFNLVIMFLAASRGVMLATIIGIILIIGVMIFTLKKRKLRNILSILFVIFIISVVSIIIYIQGKPLPQKAPYALTRLSNLMGSAEDRLIAWGIAKNGFEEKPFLGWGWANYNLIFNKYYNPYFLEKGLSATWFDHSHNQLLDILALSGILGFLAYLSIFLTILIIWGKFLKEADKQDKLAISVLSTLNIAYFIQNIFVFDTPAPLFIFIFNLALFSFYSQKQYSSKNLVKENKKNKFPLPIFIFLIILFLSFSLWSFNFSPFNQSKLGAQANQASKVDFSQSIYLFNKSLEKSTFTAPEIRALLAKTISDNKPPKVSTDTYNIGLELAISQMEKNVKEHPLDAHYWLYLGQLYGLSSDQNNKNLDLAEEALKKAFSLSPKRQEIYYELSNIYLLKREPAKALEWARQAVILDGNVGMSWWHLAVAYLVSGEKIKATKVLDKAVWQFGYYRPGLDKYFADAYKEAENYERAIYFCDKAVVNEPKDLEGSIFCFTLAKQKGKEDKANYYFSKIKEQDEELAEQLAGI
ncbi:MAG: O-Antigen ligase [Parcubacteria group bacterium ADurb.Bin159]|nr:MAG: O-Antigen ligase [Parcubacteria group bacterium ADurb.Bin159]